MKIYMFYINPADETPGRFSDVDRPTVKNLYAITNKKKIRNAFVSTRNMNIFKEKKTEMDADEYMVFANTNRESVLEWGDLRSKKEDPYPKNDTASFGDSIDSYNFPITFMEKQFLRESVDTFYEHVEVSVPNPYLLKRDLRGIFKRFGLDHIFKINALHMCDDAAYISEHEIARISANSNMKVMDTLLLKNENDYSIPDIWVDQLEVFLKLFSHLMNI